MKNSDLAFLTIDEVIVHDVPKHKKNDTSIPIDFSENVSILTPELRIFLKNKLISSFTSSNGFKVNFDNTSDSPIPNIVYKLNNSEPCSLIDNSKTIASHLYQIQTGVNPGGIVVVITGTIENHKIIAILKLERDQGARIKKNPKTHAIDLETVKELILTDKTRLYKAGIFFNETDYNCSFEGYVCDNQYQNERERNIASFFLQRFLGCMLFGDTRTITKEFFAITKQFIERIEDPVKKTSYLGHLISYVSRPAASINPDQFCSEYIELKDRQNYSNYLDNHNIQRNVFVKNTELINSQIKKIKIEFDNDISLIGTPETIKDNINMEKQKDGRIKTTFTSRMKGISS